MIHTFASNGYLGSTYLSLHILTKVLFIVENMKKRFRSSISMFCKIVVLKNFSKFPGKHLCRNLFLNKDPQLYQNRDSDTGIFLWILQNFKKTFSYKTLEVVMKSQFWDKLHFQTSLKYFYNIINQVEITLQWFRFLTP